MTHESKRDEHLESVGVCACSCWTAPDGARVGLGVQQRPSLERAPLGGGINYARACRVLY